MKMQFNKLLKQLKSKDFRISHHDLFTEFEDVVKVFLESEFLIESDPNDSIVCYECGETHGIEVLDNKFYINCDYNEDSSIQEIKKEKLISYRPSLNNLLEHIGQSLSLELNIREIERDLLHFVGKRTYSSGEINFYLLRSDDYKQAEETFKSLQNNVQPIVIYFGDNPHTGITNKRIISLFDVLKRVDNKIELNESAFVILSQTKATAKKDDIVLDEDYILGKEADKCYLLIKRKDNGSYEVEEPIRPVMYNILFHLYKRRKYKNGENQRSSKEMSVSAVGNARARTITNNIGMINKLSQKYSGIDLILLQPQYKYMLNPNLDCFQEPSS